MKLTTSIITLLFLVLISCNKEPECNCVNDFDETITYVENDFVFHDGTCWRAEAQGRGIEPGPWLQNGNDIWRACVAD